MYQTLPDTDDVKQKKKILLSIIALGVMRYCFVVLSFYFLRHLHPVHEVKAMLCFNEDILERLFTWVHTPFYDMPHPSCSQIHCYSQMNPPLKGNKEMLASSSNGALEGYKTKPNYVGIIICIMVRPSNPVITPCKDSHELTSLWRWNNSHCFATNTLT